MREKPMSIPITVFGEADHDTMQQIERCAAPRAADATLMADNHGAWRCGGTVSSMSCCPDWCRMA
jgi:hypothetical protein